MRTGKQKIILATKILCVLIVALIVAFYLFRNAVLQQTIVKVSNEMKIEYTSAFSIRKASFDGLSGLNLTDIVLVPKNADTLFKIQKLKTITNIPTIITQENEFPN